jgi:hypothetical protein
MLRSSASTSVRSWSKAAFQTRSRRGSSRPVTYRAYYGQAGYYLTRQLSVNLQADFGAYNVGLGNAPYVNLNTDYGVSLVYKFRPNLAAKVEAHRDRGSQVENVPSTSDTRTNYGILSLAASF